MRSKTFGHKAGPDRGFPSQSYRFKISTVSFFERFLDKK